MNTCLKCIAFLLWIMAPSNVAQLSSFALKSILEKDKLSGTNFTNLYRNLRIVIKHDKKDYVLDNPLPNEPDENATAVVTNAYRRRRSTDSACDQL